MSWRIDPDGSMGISGFVNKAKEIKTSQLKKEIPITEHEKLARAVDDLKKEILETRFGKFMLWILDRLSQMMNWIEKIIKKD